MVTFFRAIFLILGSRTVRDSEDFCFGFSDVTWPVVDHRANFLLNRLTPFSIYLAALLRRARQRRATQEKSEIYGLVQDRCIGSMHLLSGFSCIFASLRIAIGVQLFLPIPHFRLNNVGIDLAPPLVAGRRGRSRLQGLFHLFHSQKASRVPRGSVVPPAAILPPQGLGVPWTTSIRG